MAILLFRFGNRRNCRGAQLLAVYKGGKLECPDAHAEKLKRHSTNLFNLGKHDTKICPDTKLHKILRQDEIKVISIHHQALFDTLVQKARQ